MSELILAERVTCDAVIGVKFLPLVDLVWLYVKPLATQDDPTSWQGHSVPKDSVLDALYHPATYIPHPERIFA